MCLLVWRGHHKTWDKAAEVWAPAQARGYHRTAAAGGKVVEPTEEAHREST